MSKLLVPYETTGQELGETRLEMTKKLMSYIEEIVNKCKTRLSKYYILVHAKPFPKFPNVIKQKLLVMDTKPPMMLSCLLFGVDNETGILTLEWALPGSWPTWAMEGKNEPVPEVVSSLNELGKVCDLDKVIAY